MRYLIVAAALAFGTGFATVQDLRNALDTPETRKEAAMIAAMVKHCTTRELNAMAAFYGSEEGCSSLAKVPAYMADVLPLVEAEVYRAAAELRKENALKAGSSGT